MTEVVTITQERRRAVGCSPADMYTLALPRQGRAANAKIIMPNFSNESMYKKEKELKY